MKRRALLASLLLSSGASADLFSPGELSKSHSSLEGIENCTKCHPAGGRLSQETCLACHTELKPQLAVNKGYHGRIPESSRACESCHTDHQGPSTSLIDWGPPGKRGFEHSKSGWALKGKHANVNCQNCHEARLIESSRITKLLQEHPGRTSMLGLSSTCSSCHFDEHRAQFKETTCETCHAELGWKPAAGFSHNDTDYPLRGRHVKVPCAKCHDSVTEPAAANTFPAPVSETFLRFAPLESRQCTNCHKDTHEGRFGARCSSCHTVEGWRIIRNTAQERGFHDQTKFPLEGEHVDVPCTSCHGPSAHQKAKFKGLHFGRCDDCHADAHEGQLDKLAGVARDCKDCHTLNGFSPPKFTLADHQRTTFKLEGAHQVAACSGCHPHRPAVLDRVPAQVKKDLQSQRRPRLFSSALFEMTATGDACSGCHVDVHEGQFDKARPCQSCHTADTFHQITFNHSTDSRFALTGKHAQVKCDACHAPGPQGVTRYKPLETRCESCHADEHVGQFTTHTCEACHDTSGFKPSVGFKHQPPFTDFLLEGSHSQVACAKCHPSFAVKGSIQHQRFLGVPRTCEGCHADAHHGAFEGFAP